MPKTIVAKAEITTDPKLHIIKAFRITNKRTGEAKARGPEGHEDYLQYCSQLRSLQVQADELGFKIWVSEGKTGHTYEKDYRETPDTWNDEANYVSLAQERQRVQTQSTRTEESPIAEVVPEPEDNDVIDESLASDEDTTN